MPKAKPARPWPVRVLRRALRVLLWTSAILAVLLLVAWWFRRQLLTPLLRPQLEAVLRDALGAERVAIGAFAGDWVTAIDVEDVLVEGGASTLRELRGVRVQADYSLLALLGGDLAGLRTATVHADLVVLDLRPTGAAEASAAAGVGSFDPAPYEALLALCGGGARVHVDELRLLAPAGTQAGAADVELRPGGADREFTIAYAGLRLEARVRRRAAEGGHERVQATVDVDDPGALLDLFGLGAGVREGHLHAEASASLSPPRIEARLDLRDLVHRGRRLQKSRIEGSLDGERIAVDRATIDLPGVAAELRALTLPSPFATTPSLDALAGRFAVRIDDLAPHAALLPAELLDLMPIEGRLAGSFAAGLLQLDASELHARAVDLQLQRGTFPLASGNWRDAVGSLQFALTLREFTADVPSVGEAVLSGRIDGTLVGSLAEPQLEVRLALGACRTPAVSFASADGRARADRAALAVEALQVRGLGLAALGAGSPSSLGVDASCRLGPDGIEPDSLVANVDLGGRLPQPLLAPIFAGGEPGPAADVPWTLHLEAQHGADGITLGALRAQTDAGAPIALALHGEGIVPLRWSGTALQSIDGSECVLRVTAERPGDDRAPAATLAGTLRLTASSSDLQLDVQAAGAAQLHAEAVAERGLGSVLAADPQLAAASLRITTEIAELDLGRLPAAWFGGVELHGHVVGHVRGIGPPGALAPDIELRWTDGGVRVPELPALADVQLGLDVGPVEHDPAQTRIRLRGAGSLEQELGLDRAVGFTADIRSDETGTQLLPAVLQVGGGELALQLRSNLRRSDLLVGRVDVDRTTLAGTVGVREFALDKLPPALLGIGSLRGVATGEVELDGPLATLGPATVRSATVSLRDGELKVVNLPRIEKLAAQMEYTPGRVDLVDASGTLGAGDFQARGTVRHDDLLASIDAAAVEFVLTGQDLLLYRGDGAKVRATVDLTAAGTVRDLQVGGEIVLGRGSKYVRRISILPDLNSKGGETVNEGLRLVELPPALGERLTFDVAITTSEPFEVRTSVFDGEVDVAAGLRGKGTAPRIEGTMSMRRGLLRFPGANLRVTSGLLTFTRSEPLFPTVTVQAEGKRLGFLVSMSVTGRYDVPQVTLSSVPPLPPQDLIVLLTTGQLPSTLVARGAEGQARFVGGYLAQEVLDAWFGSDSTERGESLLDRLTIETGREVSQNGTESILVEYELLPRVAVQVERDAYEDYNLGLLLRFRFR
ncbi:MAG: translocation/assembly module TamB domain-containing protein [Planctomycetes bacterium]|nr:translocation/assembly module TamB domain-containing protein [Planctomycetota bacterium]